MNKKQSRLKDRDFSKSVTTHITLFPELLEMFCVRWMTRFRRDCGLLLYGSSAEKSSTASRLHPGLAWTEGASVLRTGAGCLRQVSEPFDLCSTVTNLNTVDNPFQHFATQKQATGSQSGCQINQSDDLGSRQIPRVTNQVLVNCKSAACGLTGTLRTHKVPWKSCNHLPG